jgi:4-hydroxybenzoate polyprenyltransferase/geranylgeranylglycerol-phosphate geranylgeranyltransferase
MIRIKEKLFAHLETWRLYTVIWCGLISLAGSCINYGGLPPMSVALLAIFIPMIGWTAGLYLSDFLDRRLDAIQKPHRPIPSGRIKPVEALTIGAIFAFTGFFLSFLLSYYNVILVFIVAALVFFYAKITKSRGLAGNVNRGLVAVTAYFFGVFSTRQPIGSIPIYVWLLSTVFLFHDTNSNLVGAIRDMEGDKKGGYMTVPVKYGLKKSIFISLLFTIIWLSILFYVTIRFNFLKNDFYLFMILDIFILISLYIYLLRSVNNYDRRKALKFHEFFVIERITLASALIIGITSYYIGITIFFITIVITILSQHLLRKRYEFLEKE